MSKPLVSTTDSGIASRTLEVIPKKLAPSAIAVAEVTETKMRRGDVPMALIRSCVDGVLDVSKRADFSD